MAATKTSTAAQPNNPFIKQLASSNRTTRDRALSSLRTYLSYQKALSALDNLKLWKGLFYCMFMSDKPRNQQALARDLADLLSASQTLEGQLAFVKAFWQTLSREWNNIDSLRLDKYLYLVRCYVNAGFELLAKEKWNEDVVKRYNEILAEEGGPLSARDSKVPNGLRLHVLDIWVDELEKVDGEERKASVEHVMAPVKKLSKESLTKSVRERARDAVEDDRLLDGKAWREAESDEEKASEEGADEGDDFGGFDD